MSRSYIPSPPQAPPWRVTGLLIVNQSRFIFKAVDEDNTHFCKVGQLRDYTTLYPRKLSYSPPWEPEIAHRKTSSPQHRAIITWPANNREHLSRLRTFMCSVSVCLATDFGYFLGSVKCVSVLWKFIAYKIHNTLNIVFPSVIFALVVSKPF
jgi:hypothetical protein